MINFYRVKDNQDVKLKVKHLFGQPGASHYALSLSPPVSVDPDQSVSLGSGGALRHKRLVISSSLKDEQPATNKLGVEYHLQGGEKDFSRSQEETVDDDGEAWFNLVVKFV